ncbi:hypothetical protein L1987_58561 [Smallanthus sonchifolius]|uniref:Uncharacterized protein n=1 Tax=Smallanthus sonchifolius TaxID=185202 RepID=A0ACB9DFK2_9ASTR|nr:hypothetical protein L1987_58561 [Smallanthus sonchifolius]
MEKMAQRQHAASAVMPELERRPVAERKGEGMTGRGERRGRGKEAVGGSKSGVSHRCDCGYALRQQMTEDDLGVGFGSGGSVENK